MLTKFLINTESSKSEPCSLEFHGPFAASESEVRHIMNFIQKEKNAIKGLLSLHSYSQLIAYPYGFQQGKFTPDVEEQVYLFLC